MGSGGRGVENCIGVLGEVKRNVIEMARAAKRPANEPLTGLFTGPLLARFYRCLLLNR